MTGNQDEFQRAMNQGHSAAWDQMWDRAAEFYKQALEEFPEHTRALTSLGLALYELQDFDQALGMYQRAAEISANDPLPIEKIAQIHERLGRLNQAQETAMYAAELYLREKDFEKAVENWTRVTRLNPTHMDARTRLALAHERLGRVKPAVTEYLAVASLLQHEGKMDEAIQTVNHALQLNPDSVEARQAQAMLKTNKTLPRPVRQRGGTGALRMARVRQLEAPKEDEDDRAEMDPIAEARQKALTALAGMLFDASDEESAEVSGRRNPLISPRSGDSVALDDRTINKIKQFLGQAIDLQTRGNDEEAADTLERAISAGMDNPAAYFDLAILRSQEEEQFDNVVRYLQHAVKHNDFALGSRLMLGQTLLKMGSFQDAVKEFLEALKIADSAVVPTDNADMLRQMYEPLIETQSTETNEDILQRLCENISELIIQPDWRDKLIQAREQLPSSNGGPPVPLAEILTEGGSSEVVSSLNSIHQLAEQGLVRSAMEEAFIALTNAPTYLPLHTFIADLLIRQERLDEALSKLKIIAQTYNSRGESTQAMSMYRRITQLAPMDLPARQLLIDQLINRGQMDDALNEHMNLADAYYRLAELDMSRKTYKNALRMAQQYNLDRSWSVEILHQMADIDLQRLDWRQALRVYEQIRTLEPDDERAPIQLINLNNRLGQESQAKTELDNYLSYLESQNKGDEIPTFVEKLAQDNPDRVYVQNRLADLYISLNRNADAIEQLDKVGELLLDMGDRDGAVEVIKKIILLDPPNVDEYKDLLEQLNS
jgi:tetratricopeptide (TPR) repeat protein